MSIEGTEICDWISARGVTCVLLKYRVPKSDHYWDKDCKCHITPPVAWALQDAQRAIRIVRAKAKELHIDPNKIGVIGFRSEERRSGKSVSVRVALGGRRIINKKRDNLIPCSRKIFP